VRVTVFIALTLLAAALPAGAAVLYKSVDAKGIVTFSDLPPPPGIDAKAIAVPESSSATPGASRDADVTASAPPVLREEQIMNDEVVQRAAAKVDLAEHALAMARRPVWEVADPMKLTGPRFTRADRERIDYYRKDLKIAQQQLADVLRTRRKAEAKATMTAEAGAPIYGPLGPTVFRR
jgi:Domain of unknown function (DUF4124)